MLRFVDEFDFNQQFNLYHGVQGFSQMNKQLVEKNVLLFIFPVYKIFGV